MKHVIAMLLLVFIFISTSAQQLPDAKGYWVIENNIKTPKESSIYFYTPTHELMYVEKLSGKKIKLNRKKTVRKLNAALEEVSLAWNRNKELKSGLAFTKL